MFFKKKDKPKATQITDANFNQMIAENRQGVLLDFYADWCGPCKVLGPIIDELSDDYKGRVLIGKVNVDQNPKLSELFKIKSIPTLAFIKDQKLIEVLNGLVPKPNLEEMLDDLIQYTFEEGRVKQHWTNTTKP